MSISGHIRSLHGNGLLSPYRPRFSKKSMSRRLYLTLEALNDFNSPNSAVNILVGHGYVEAALDKWVLRGRINGDRKGGSFLKRLDAPPPEIWEIRVTDPSIQARLIGRFAEQDTLILTRMYTRSLLGDRGSASWNEAMVGCVAVWDALFGGFPPLSATTINDYVSENFDVYPI